jgi:hypothetical protein
MASSIESFWLIYLLAVLVNNGCGGRKLYVPYQSCQKFHALEFYAVPNIHLLPGTRVIQNKIWKGFGCEATGILVASKSAMLSEH